MSSAEENPLKTNITNSNQNSVVEFCGHGNRYCGYCKAKQDTRISYDFRAIRLTVSDYQDLLDRYFRRSGKYCYRPTNNSTCCPNYSISCMASKFLLSRSQRRCIERMNSFLLIGDDNDLSKKLKLEYHGDGQSNRFDQLVSKKLMTKDEFEKLESSNKLRDKRFIRSCKNKAKHDNIDLNEAIRIVIEKNVSRYNKPLLNLEDYLYPTNKSRIHGIEPKHNLNIKLHPSESFASLAIQDEKVDLMQRYQLAVHQEDESHWTTERYAEFLAYSPLITEQITDYSHVGQSIKYIKDGDNLCASLADTSNYFLLKPPPLPTHYGSYHCLYYLDDKLIAVGVLDVLPKCITTVYFYYDPEYSFLNLGIYSALLEISMVRQLYKNYLRPANQSQLKHYYLGFYIHSCKKMHYKPTFRPSYLQCNETYQYCNTQKCLDKLKNTVYTRFSDEPFVTATPQLTMEDLFLVKIIIPSLGDINSRQYISWMRQNLGHHSSLVLLENVFARYFNLVGRELASRIHLDLSLVHDYIMEMKDK